MNKITLFFLFSLLARPAGALTKPYFQQEVNYHIQVSLNDERHELTASESIEYINNSGDVLPFLYFHIWPNAYRENTTCLGKQLTENGDLKFYFAKEEDRGFIDRLNFKVNGDSVRWEFAGDTIDICRIWLNKPLQPGERITITTPFRVKIPLGIFSRLGHLDQQYQITQWYPKPAVYDQNGWNQMPFLNQGEFYSEFGSYDVEITLPRNYVVGATGDLVGNEEEKTFMASKVAETIKWKEEFASSGKKDMKFPESDKHTKTLHFHQSQVHDFAWFCDKRYHVLEGEVETPHDKHKVTTRALFTDATAGLWLKSLPYLHDAIYFYSLWNGDYAYDQVTAVDGGLSAGAGMEYPNITVIGKTSNDFTLETVIMHEVGHNWFYGMLGSNERKNPWMDEGINSFNENRYIETKFPDARLVGNLAGSKLTKMLDIDVYLHKHQYYLTYLINAAKEMDQPIQLPAAEYTTFNYAGIVYSKTAITFDYLMAYLGTKTMDAAMQEYFETWKFKHPQPNDLRKILEKVSGKDLSWFFDDMINGIHKLDYEILSSKKVENGYTVVVSNTGQIKGPVSICGIKDNKLRGIVWYDGFWNTERLSFPPVEGGVDYFMIDYNSDMPEINRNNNILRTQGVFKRIEPLKLQFLGSLDRPDRTQLFWSPVLGWNEYNKFMFGVSIYNNIVPQKRFEYILMPLYAAGSKSLAGYGSFNLNFPLQQGLLQQITFRLSASRYAYDESPFPLQYNRIVPELSFEFRKKRARSPIKQVIRLRSIAIIEDNYTTDYSQSPSIIRGRDTMLINDLSYSLVNSRKLNPYSLLLDYQAGQKMQKISLTANYELTFEKKKSIDMRFFIGTFLQTNNHPAYAFRLSGEYGPYDYLYDHTYLGRSETQGILSRQMTETDGGFKVYSPWGQTVYWLTAVNFKFSLPVLPRSIRLFMDIGTCDGRSLNQDNPGPKIMYDAGINFSVIKNMVEIYFPLAMSDDISNYIYTTQKYKYYQTIRFTLNMDKMNPLELIRNISF
ncbi:MAG: M1 family metallopeptidase [Bacteroidia bacterium]